MSCSLMYHMPLISFKAFSPSLIMIGNAPTKFHLQLTSHHYLAWYIFYLFTESCWNFIVIASTLFQFIVLEEVVEEEEMTKEVMMMAMVMMMMMMMAMILT